VEEVLFGQVVEVSEILSVASLWPYTLCEQ
jgi:hypothetical protein